MLNFFQSTINVDILILENANIQVQNNGRVIYEGSKEYCMNKLRREVFNLQGIANKTVSFTVKSWSNYSSNPKLIADAKSFFRNHLGMLKSSTKTNIKLAFGGDAGFAAGGGGGRSW